MQFQIHSDFKGQKIPVSKLLLKEFEKEGFTTLTGSNTWLISNIVGDFLEKTIKEKMQQQSVFNFWETENLALASILAFRFRVYNERHQPLLVKGRRTGLEWSDVSEFLKKDFEISAKMQKTSVIVAPKDFSLQNPISIPKEYDFLTNFLIFSLELSDGSEITLEESKMQPSGKFEANDFSVFPDLADPKKSLVHLVGSSEKIQKLLERKDEISKIRLTFGFLNDIDKKIQTEFDVLIPELIVSPDLLRFTVSELLGKLEFLSFSSIDERLQHCRRKFGNFDFLVQNNKIFWEASTPEFCVERISEIIPEFLHEKVQKISISIGTDAHAFLHILEDKVKSILEIDDLTKPVFVSRTKFSIFEKTLKLLQSEQTFDFNVFLDERNQTSEIVELSFDFSKDFAGCGC